MKNFAKKLISAAMALTLAASMSVYAEETAPIENVKENLHNVIPEYSVYAISCNHVTYRNDEYFVGRELVGTHKFNEQVCYVWVETYQYDLICMKCRETVGHVPRTVDVHSINHP